MGKLGWLWVCAGLAACGGEAATSTSAGTVDAAVDTTAAADAAPDVAPDVGGADASNVDALSPAAVCAKRAGGYVINGTCSNGASSIPYACLKVDGCTGTWQADFRGWTGDITGSTFLFSSAKGDETIDGSFSNMDDGAYHYAGMGITCDADFSRLQPTVGEGSCCDIHGEDCDATRACLPAAEDTDAGLIVTTECIEVAANAVAPGQVCTPQQDKSTCQSGGFCMARIGAATSESAHCKSLCTKAGDCAAGESCVLLTDAPPVGVCDTACGLFADATSAVACPDNGVCQVVSAISPGATFALGTVCAAPTKLKAGSACKGLDCPAGHACGLGTCKPLCDAAHPCVGGGTCTSFGVEPTPGIDPSIGFCK